MIQTTVGVPVSDRLMQHYLSHLVDRFYKILPMREEEEQTLGVYVHSLLIELIGCQSLIVAFDNDRNILSLLSILRYFADHPDCPVDDVKREVFRSIRILNGLERRYKGGAA